MLDEPINGLDPEGVLWVRNSMRALAAECRTVFPSSHLMSEMSLTADHLIIIGRGRLLADMSTKDFIEHSSHNYVLIRLHEIFLQRSSLEEAYMEMTHDSVEYHTEAATPGVAEGEQ